MTLDRAIGAYQDNPCDDTAVELRAIAHEYCDDGMITEQEMWDLFAWTDGGAYPYPL